MGNLTEEQEAMKKVIIDEVIKLSKGNPGAATFLITLTGSLEHVVHALVIIPKIKKCGIVGTDLYILWSDLCNKDMARVAHLCKHVPDEVLIDACSRQDYSGRSLVAEYWENI
jgi:hypothetical protein